MSGGGVDKSTGRRPSAERRGHSAERLEDLDTARLVKRFQAGDREAFTALYTRYFDRVFAYLRVLLKRTEDAEDGAQEVFVKALEALPRYELRGRPFRSWLFVIVRNYAVQKLQKESRIELLDPEELTKCRERAGAVEPDLQIPGWITDSDLVVFIERVPLPQRQVLMLRYMMGMNTAEIVRVLGYSADNVRKLQARGVDFLRERLKGVGRESSSSERTGSQAYQQQARVVRARRYSLTGLPTG